MARKIVAVAPAHPDRMSYFVFCDDGTVWSWEPPQYLNQVDPDQWTQLGTELPQGPP